MHERGKSDRFVVPANPPNKATAAEVGEERERAKGNTDGKTHPGPSAGTDASSALGRVREVARRDKDARFTALLHHVTPSRLRRAYWAISPKAAPGVDWVTWDDYGRNLEANLLDLHGRVQSGRYRAKPSRRVYIPKPDGRMRPLGIASLEDKIVQRAVVEVLNAVYEVDFRGFSYGFRPGRGPHDALDALAVGIERKRVNWVLDADIRNFFGQIDHAWLRRFVEHRIADKRIWRLIGKWLAAGVIEDGQWSACEEGSPQGASASPLLANVYLHYVFDLWADHWRRHHADGDVIIVRFADDFIVGFRVRGGCAAVPRRATRAVREVRAGAAPGQDAADRVRAARRHRPAASGSGQAGDVRLPGLYAHLCAEPAAGGSGCGVSRSRNGCGRSWPRSRPSSSVACMIPSRCRGGGWPGCCKGTSPTTPCRATPTRYRPSGTRSTPALAPCATAAQPARPDHLGADGQIRDSVAPASPCDASLPERALRSQNLRQEPNAVVPHAGIRAGGRP